MSPTNDKSEQRPALSPPREPHKPRRFRLVRLEERIAPQAGGGTVDTFNFSTKPTTGRMACPE
jgi:hypothetical protein